jgi:hypothetical protein
MTLLWINILLAVPFVALWTGIPLWLVLRHPDAGPALAAAPAVTLPARRRQDDDYRRAA